MRLALLALSLALIGLRGRVGLCARLVRLLWFLLTHDAHPFVVDGASISYRGSEVTSALLVYPDSPMPLERNPDLVYDAEYESRCPACDETIMVGDEIVSVDGEWVHLECDCER